MRDSRLSVTALELCAAAAAAWSIQLITLIQKELIQLLKGERRKTVMISISGHNAEKLRVAIAVTAIRGEAVVNAIPPNAVLHV
jgi:hypothetical protein